MAYIALYRKWRPQIFEDVVEQEHVVKTLKNSVKTGRIAHAYLLCGTRGTGKTTIAHILSRAINCLNPREGDPCNQCEVCKGILSGSILDVVEIDAASNNSVDNVREIRDEVVYMPSQAKYKVYIIDEVHMLSSGAFNALLKTLEEPPAHVVFILATTEPHKLPATILSRCQRFDFRRISVESIIERVVKIAEAGDVSIQKDAARLIAKMADGALRDAISILDQCISMGNSEISYSDVMTVAGVVNDEFIGNAVDAIKDKDINKILEMVDRLVMDGKDITQFVSDLVLYYRNLLICKITGKPGEIIEASEEILEKLKKQGGDMDQDELIHIIKELSSLESGFKWSTHPRVLLEVSLIKVCGNYFKADDSDISGRLAKLEQMVSSADFAAKSEVYGNNIGSNKESNVREGNEMKLPPSSQSVSYNSIEGNSKGLEFWESVLTELKNSGRVAIYTNLIGTKAVELDSKFVGIVFNARSDFQKTMVSKVENAEVVEGLLNKRLGREVRIKCVDEATTSGGKKDKIKEGKDEFEEKAQNIAKRLNTPFNVIDE